LLKEEMMKLAVNNNCVGHGRCYTVAPDLLSPDDDGAVSIRGTSIEVPQHQIASARDAESSCPENAISLTE
jgi:ferredoxin